MGAFEWILLAALGVLVLFFLVILIRAALFRPKSEPKVDDTPVPVDAARATECLSALVRCKTVSNRDPSLEDDGEFEKLIAALPTLYPNVARVCTLTRLPGRALLYCWRGKEATAPAVLMAHYDVVPANADAWEEDPFAGVIRDGCLWGRGTLDTKVTVNGILFAADRLIGEGFVPANDIYFAFSGGEEVNGPGASHIVSYFEERGIDPAFVLDEGGAVVEGVFPGLSRPCGLVGIAEKGMMDVEYKVRSNGGHASAPKPNAPIDRLSRACARVLSRPTKLHLTAPVVKMFDTLGRHSTFLYRVIFANLRLFLPVLDRICKKGGGEMNALLRTTVAFTQMQGSAASNVIPPEASLVSNIRINPAEDMEGVLAHLRRAVGDENVEIRALHGMNPSCISRTEGEGYARIEEAVASTWRGCVVSPYLMVQCSDSRHWGRISDRVYRFSAMDLTGDERAAIHGNNEKIRIDAISRTVEFYLRLMEKC